MAVATSAAFKLITGFFILRLALSMIIHNPMLVEGGLTVALNEAVVINARRYAGALKGIKF